MGLDFDPTAGQTPLDPHEKEGLIITFIETVAELDEIEQENIEQAIQWVIKSNFKIEKVFTEQFVKSLHKKMYGSVWKWAGKFRLTDKNIGIDKSLISEQLKILLDDALYWITNTTYSPQEIAIRFKHRLVSIHCFPNGNGRHSRLMADIIIEKLYKLPVFTWGNANLTKMDEPRKEYIKAIKAADEGDIDHLIKFATS